MAHLKHSIQNPECTKGHFHHASSAFFFWPIFRHIFRHIYLQGCKCEATNMLPLSGESPTGVCVCVTCPNQYQLLDTGALNELPVLPVYILHTIQ